MAKASKPSPSQSCIEIAIAASNGLINGKEAVKAFDMANKIKQDLLEGPFKTNMDKRVAAEVGRMAAEVKLAALINKQTYMRNVIVFRDMLGYVDEMHAQGMTYAQAINAYLHGTVKNKKSGRVSVESTRQGYETELTGLVLARIIQAKKGHILKLLNNKEFDTAVAHELHAPGSTGNSDAKWFAENLAERMEWSRVKRNSLGAYIQKAAGYAGPQIDNDIKMFEKGKDAWVEFTVERLDLKKTFPHLDPAKDIDEIRSILGDNFDKIVSGSNRESAQVNFSIDDTVKNYNTAANISKSRFKHFKSADAAIEYQAEYGVGGTITSILESFKSDARDMASMEKLSNNSSAMMDRVLGELEARLVARGASKDETNTLKSAAFKDSLDIATGEASFIQNHKWAKVHGEIRAAGTMALLGRAVLGAIPADTVTTASASLFRGGGYIDGMRQVLFSKFSGLTKEEKLMDAYLHGEGFDAIIGMLSRDSLAVDGRIGALSKHLDTFFKISGLGPWTDRIRGIASRIITAQFGKESGKQFANLHWKFQNVLAQNGIDAPTWNAMRHAVGESSNGNLYSNPMYFTKIPADTITPLIADELATANSLLMAKHTKDGKFDQVGFDEAWTKRRSDLIEAKREKLKMQYLGYVAGEVNFSVVETSDADRAMIARLGMKGSRGSIGGEAARYILQFSSFPLSFAHKVLGRQFVGTDSKLANAGHVGSMMAGMLVAGYMSNLMVDLSKGITPAIPAEDNWKDLFYKSAVKGGMAGFYGDSLLGALYQSGGATDMMGPEVGAMFKTATAIGDLLERKYQQSAGGIMDVALNHTPYANLFYLRPVLDMAFLTELDKQVHPKRNDNQNTRLKKFNQERFIPNNIWDQ